MSPGGVGGGGKEGVVGRCIGVGEEKWCDN